MYIIGYLLNFNTNVQRIKMKAKDKLLLYSED